MSIEIYITCISNPGLNKFFRANKVLVLDSPSVWDAALEILDESGEYLKSKVQLKSEEYFKVYGFVEDVKTMIIYDSKITFEKTKVYKQYGNWEIPKDSILQEIFPTEMEFDFDIDLGLSIEVKNGKFPID